jgi:hypothetical protein
VLEVVWLISGEEKLELLSTWRRYEVAPLTLPQLKVGVVSHVLLPFEGEDREGAEEGAVRMVKLQVDDHEPVPQELDACTRQ